MAVAITVASAGASAAPVPGAVGPESLAGVTDGARVGAFACRALYLDETGQPKGARFVHANGMPVDVLYFASVPQVSLYAKSLPVSEKGEPHTLEHLAIGKGRIGKYLNTLLSMRLGVHTAGTYTDMTNYQFYTAAGPAGFYELLETYVKALIHPEFTDEEIRREVANLEVVEGEGGALHLEEKGTVYNEMVSTMEKAGSVNWRQLGRMVFGEGHPLAKNAGGEPAAIREMTPSDIRAFHAANYHLGPNLVMIAVIPLAWRHGEFLEHLDAMFGRIEPSGAPRAYATVPPFRAGKPGEIRIGAFPSDDASLPQDAFVAWRPLPDLSKEDAARLSVLLDVVAGGETSYLYAELVDQKTRTLDCGATGVSGFVEDPPAHYPGVYVSGLPVAEIESEKLAKIRGVVLDRIRWIAALSKGAELSGVSDKAKARIAAARRSMRKFCDDPPNFGQRHSGAAWHRHLDHLNAGRGFRKDVSLAGAYDRLSKEIESGANPWTEIIKVAGLLEVPCVSAVRPDAALLAKDKSDKAARLAGHEKRLMNEAMAPDTNAGLAAYRQGVDAKTAELEARDKQIEKPPFVTDPPLTLDDVECKDEVLACGPRIVRTHFGSTPFTRISLHFDLTRVAEGDLPLLPVLELAIRDVGVTTAAGERLDYVQAQERIQREIYGLGVSISSNPARSRYELSLTASASTPEEVDRAVEWLGNYLFRPALDGAARARLADVVRRSVKDGRTIFQRSEESWVDGAAAAYVYQDSPAHMHLSSPFTTLHDLSRLAFLLEEPAADQRQRWMESLQAVDALLASKAKREDVAARVGAIEGDLGDFLKFEISHLPPVGWEGDLARAIAETKEDLATDPAKTIERVKGLLVGVLGRTGARVSVTGNPANTGRAAKVIDALLSKLPESGAVRGVSAGLRSLVSERIAGRLPGTGRPVHVGLVNNASKSGVHVVSADGPGYASTKREDALDFLAAEVFSGAAPHSFFMQTWSAGLAYSNGVHASAASGRLHYYAERCPDLAQTMKFVCGIASGNKLDDPFLLEYALGNCYGDYRGGQDFDSRGDAMAANLTDGVTPDLVRAWKTLLLATALEKGSLAAVRDRMPGALGRVLSGYGTKVSPSPGAVDFLIGPEELLANYEVYLKAQGESDRLVRLYPRDFRP